MNLAERAGSRSLPPSAIPVFVLFLFILIAPLLALAPIGGSSEAREAQVAWVISEHGAWLLPDRNGLVASKPPLYHWMVAALSKGLGYESVWLARVVSFGAALLVTLITIRLVRMVMESSGVFRPLEVTQGRLLIVGVLGTLYGFQALAGVAMVDMTFALWTTLSIAVGIEPFLINFRRPMTGSSLHGPARQFLFWLCIGFAILSKGPLGFVLPVLVVLIVGRTFVGWRVAFRSLFAPLPILSGMLLGASWYLLVALNGQWEFLKRQLVFENVQRFTGGAEINSEAWWFYLPEFLRAGLPWSLLFLIALGLWLRTLVVVQGGSAWISSKKPVAVGAIWFSVGLLLFSIASGKRTSYLLPLYPGMVVFLVPSLMLFWRECSGSMRAVIRRTTPFLWMAFTLFLTGCAVFGTLRGGELLSEPYRALLEPLLASPVPWAVVLASAVGLSVLAVVLLRGYVVGLILSASVALLFVIQAGNTIKNSLRGFETVAEVVRALATDLSKLVVVRTRSDELTDPVLYYLRHRVQLADPSEVASLPAGTEFLARQSTADLMEAQGMSLQVRTRFQQPGDTLRGREDRILVFAVVQNFHDVEGESS